MHSTFPGRGDLAALCRTHDWASTPLGPAESWPLSLRTLVASLLASRHPMVLFWGPELIQIYNDAYRPSLGGGTRHPAALGARARDFWDEIWPLIGPQLEDIMAGGPATRHENQPVQMTRNGQVEEVFWTYGYSAVPDDDGGVGGVLCVCQETTAQVRAEQEATALARRLTQVLESITDAFFTLDRNLRFAYVNAEAERVLERSRDELLGRTIWDAFPEAVGSTFHAAYERAMAEQIPVHFEEWYPPLSRWFSVHAYPSEAGLTVYFQDVTQRRETEARLRERESILGIAGRMARIGGWRADLAKGVAYWSREVCEIHGVPEGTVLPIDQAMEFYAPEWRPVIEAEFRRCVEEGTPFDADLQLITAAGERIWVRVIGEAIRREDGSIHEVRGAFQDVDRRKRIEQELRDSDRRFRQLAEAMPLIVWSAEPDGRVDYQTRAMLEFTGLSQEELMGAGWVRAIHPDDRNDTAAAWTRSISTGEPYQVQFRIRGADGAWRWFLTRAQPFRNEAGAIVKWYGSSTDIHDSLELQRGTEALANRLTTTLESITDAFYLLDSDWHFSFVNEEAERVLEQSRSALVGQCLWDRFPATVGSVLEDEFRRATDDGTTAAFRFFYPPLDRWFDVRAYPSSEGLAVYFRDVSAERADDLRLQEQAQLLDRAQDAILVRTLDHTLVYWNAGAERVYGWSAEEVLGKSALDLLYRDADAVTLATARVLEHGEWSGELEHVHRDGTLRSVEGRWSLVRGDDGTPQRILAINTDITERKKLQAQFLRAQRLESIGTLAGGIAHDLNNVLSPILMSIGLLRMDIQDPAGLDVLDTIETAARRGAEMVKQVLAFARGVEGARVGVDLSRLVEEVGRIIKDTFPKNIRFRAVLPSDMWQLVGDPTQVHQVFMNLVVNARDAMPQGGNLTISVENILLDEHYAALSSEAEPGPHVCITVADSGSGIPPGVLAQIFDPFFTTKDVGKGTGLGLSTVAAIVRSHGGFMNVYSEPGTGTRFRLYFPASGGLGDHGSGRGSSDLIRGNGELILVVDDERSVRDITQQTLEAFGYRVLTATDGADAVAIYARHADDISLVLTDMVMPIMDGPTTIRALSRMDPGVRIVAASGLGANGGVIRASDAGVRHFLPKPYTAETLLLTIHQALQDTVEP